MRTDVVLDPFGADAGWMIEVAVAADEAGIGGVWVLDHLSGVVADAPWAQEPFVLLGAIATATSHARLGPLVANVVNRHPVTLASAMGTLASLAPGRVVCGLGSGASPASRFAAEHVVLARELDDAATRRDRLVEHVEAFRAVWSTASGAEPVTFDGAHVTMRGVHAVVPPLPLPPIVIGASAAPTVRAAAGIADGVNIRRTSRLAELVELARVTVGNRPGRVAAGFEISVFDSIDVAHPFGGPTDELADLGVHARTLFVPAGTDPAVVATIAARCRERFGPDLSR